MTYQFAEKGDQQIEKRLLDRMKELIDDRISRSRQVRPALLGQGCDGLATFNLLGPAGDVCGEGTAGAIVYAGLINGVPVQVAGTARPYAGAGGSLPLTVAREAGPGPDRGRRFADSDGNLFGHDGVYLEPWNAASAYLLGVEYAPVAKINRFRYEYDVEDPGVYMERFGSGARVDLSFSWGGVTYPCGVIANWDWADPSNLSDTYPGDPAAVGIGVKHVPPRSYKSDHVCLCVEAKAQPDPSSLPGQAYGLTLRDVQNGMTNASILYRIETLPASFVYPMGPVSGSGAGAVASRNMWHVSAAPDGAWWIHNAGTRVLQRWLYDMRVGTVVKTEELTLTGGATWGAKTIAKQVR